jgi:hypothetical protein
MEWWKHSRTRGMVVNVPSLASMNHLTQEDLTHLTHEDYCDLTLAARFAVRDDLNDYAIEFETVC